MKIGKAQFDVNEHVDWYFCPNCARSEIQRKHHFCPMCGVRLEWEEA